MATELRDDLLDFDDENQLADKRIKPALLALLHDQAELLDSSGGQVPHDIRDGFPNRRALIEWYQRAIVRTLGYIADEWEPESCVNDSVLLSGVLTSFTAEEVPMPREKAEWYRHMLEVVAVQPSFNRAYKKMRRYAQEYVQRPGEEDHTPTGADLDPSKQAYLAMRPGFQVLDAQQHRALTDLWGGFEDVDSLKDWLHALNSPTNGEISSGMAEEFVSDGYAMERLVYDTDSKRSRTYRETLAATVILPAFVDGVRSIDTEELAKETSGKPTTMRMKGKN